MRAVTLEAIIQEGDRVTCYAEVLRGFPQSLQANAVIVPELGPVYVSSFYSALCSLDNESGVK
jgi:hypothetical protein